MGKERETTLAAGSRVALLASYCGDSHAGCTDNHPCMDCLLMCNSFELTNNVTAVYTKQIGGIMPEPPKEKS